MTILEFADVINKKIIVTYYPNQNNRFSANFEDCETKEGMCLCGEYGTSDNADGAINDYAYKILGKELVFKATGKDRQEFTAPKKLTMLGE